MKLTRIQYNSSGEPNFPSADPLLLYGMSFDGLDAEGPALGQWDTTLLVWSDDKGYKIEWHPVYFCVPPANPCQNVAAPTIGNEVV